MKLTIKETITANRISPKELVEKLLILRKIENREEFLNPPDPQSFSLKDFGFSVKQIKTLFETLEKVKQENKTVVVYTDYDADGITGGAIMWETLNMLGFKVMPYVPHRKLEGYGFSIIGIDRIKADYDPALIISVDHGITAVEQIKYAKTLGIDVIITDHHHKQEQIPEAAKAIFHIPALSGSGAAYFVAKEIAEHFMSDSKYKVRLTNNFKTDYLALASIGTVADLVPLVGPSRSVVAHGLKRFNHVKRIGILQICKEAKIDNKPITPYEIGFVIAPRI
ncbi:MAG: DHH family phosphoesterase, partial [Weeksellaceae bacterium]